MRNQAVSGSSSHLENKKEIQHFITNIHNKREPIHKNQNIKKRVSTYHVNNQNKLTNNAQNSESNRDFAGIGSGLYNHPPEAARKYSGS